MGELRTERKNGVLSLRLDRPAKRNALSETLVEDLLDAVQGAYDEPTDLVVFRGEGGCFSAGFDFSGLAETTDAELLYRFVRIEQLLQLVYHAPFDTLALAHGRVFGAGADLLCACARRVAAPGSTFRLPGLAFGVVLGTRRLAERVGTAAARRIQAGGDTIDAAQALETGLITELVDTEDWTDRISRASEEEGWLDRRARAVFQRALAPGDGDAELADLVRSASVPGLRQRIQHFRKEQAG